MAEKALVKVRALALIGDDRTGYHGSSETRAAVAEFLWSLPWLDTDVTGDWHALRWERIAPYDLVVHFAGGWKNACTDDQFAGLLRFVERGGAYVPLHFTTANVNVGLVTLIGAKLIGHPPFGPFDVRIADPDHPIMRGLGPFQIEDECYHNEFPDREALHVLTTSHHPDPSTELDREPSTWVREVGRGRVFYAAFGHDKRVWPHPQLRELVTRGIRWAARLDPVALPAAGR